MREICTSGSMRESGGKGIASRQPPVTLYSTGFARDFVSGERSYPHPNPTTLTNRRSRRKKRSQVEVFRELSSNGRIRVRQPRAKPWGASKREKTLIFFTAAVLTANVWGFGGTSWWLPTVVTFYAGLAAIAWLLVPLPSYWDVDADGQDSSPRANAKRILSFPIFWIGLALLAYMSISGLNPRAQMWVDGQRLWFTGLDHIQWLPSGLKTPFEDMNAWRTVMLYAGPFMLLCALVAGTHQRRSLNVLLYAIVINAVPLAVYGGWFRSQDYYAGVTKIYGLVNFQWFGFPYIWTIRPFGPILGPNIAAAFLNLSMATTMALLTPLFTKRGWADHRKLAHVITLALALVILSAGLIFTASKAGLILCAALYGFWGVVLFVRAVTMFESKMVGVATGGAVLVAVAAALLVTQANVERILPRYSAMRVAQMENISESGAAQTRLFFYQRTWEMALDQPWTGHGAGTFRYAVTRYINRAFMDADDPTEERKFGRLTHAHNDYLQFLAEFGVIGAGLAVLLLGTMGIMVVRRKPWRDPMTILLVGGVGTLMVHAAVDFPTAVGLVLVTGGVMIMACVEKRGNTDPRLSNG